MKRNTDRSIVYLPPQHEPPKGCTMDDDCPLHPYQGHTIKQDYKVTYQGPIPITDPTWLVNASRIYHRKKKMLEAKAKREGTVAEEPKINPRFTALDYYTRLRKTLK